MPRLSRVQETAQRQVARLAGLGLPPDTLGARIVSALDAAIGFDGYRLFGLDPQTLLVNRLLAASVNDDRARIEWFNDAYLSSAPLTYAELPNLMRHHLPVVAFQDRQEVCWGYPPALLAPVTPRDHERFFHEQRAPVGGSLLASFSATGQWLAALQAYRRDPERRFRAGDIAFVRHLAPTIGRLLAAALARERATLAPEGIGPGASGIMIVGPDLKLRFGTPAGHAWCELLADRGRGQLSPLPTVVYSTLAALRASDGAAPAITLITPSPVGPVRVEASPAGEDGAVAVVLAPCRPTSPPGIPADWPLTPQERRVVTSLIAGQTNRQIAETLCVSEHTIEWHLRHAYDKLGVSSRTRLLARYFHEVFLSELAEDVDEGPFPGAVVHD